jgi:hypothetical protein
VVLVVALPTIRVGRVTWLRQATGWPRLARCRRPPGRRPIRARRRRFRRAGSRGRATPIRTAGGGALMTRGRPTRTMKTHTQLRSRGRPRRTLTRRSGVAAGRCAVHTDRLVPVPCSDATSVHHDSSGLAADVVRRPMTRSASRWRAPRGIREVTGPRKSLGAAGRWPRGKRLRRSGRAPLLRRRSCGRRHGHSIAGVRLDQLESMTGWWLAAPCVRSSGRTAQVGVCLPSSGRSGNRRDGEERVDRGIGAEMERPGHAKSAGVDHRLPEEQPERAGRDEPHHS